MFIITTTSSDFESLPILSFESLEEAGDVVADEEYYEEKVEEIEEHKEGTLYIQNEGIEEEGTESEDVANMLAQDDNDDEGEETILTTNEELVDTEELNKKFEEFIRKMKEEMKIEAQTHLIVV
ncbi:hypothetical protein RYX36_001858 [Vicia faba]